MHAFGKRQPVGDRRLRLAVFGGLARLARTPEHLIDINPLAGELGYIREEGDEIRIGAMTRHREVLENDLLAERPVWLFSSGPVGDAPEPAQETADTDRLADLVGADTVVFHAGRKSK